MIKTNELRLGNLVGYKPNKIISACPIETIEKYRVVIIFKNNILCLFEEQLHPIDLTDDWLIKLGFKKEPDGVFWWNSQIAFMRHPIRDNLIHVGREDTPIPYVHTLQNWYFFTFGEELQIKTTP